MSDKTPHNEEIELSQFLAIVKESFGAINNKIGAILFGVLKALIFLIVGLKRNWKNTTMLR